MKASELIKRIEAMIAIHGDLPVWAGRESGYEVEVNPVSGLKHLERYQYSSRCVDPEHLVVITD